MFNVAFDACGAAPGDYYPEELRPEIDQLNTRIYDTLNNGVYKAGFATTQDAYEHAVTALFDTLCWLDDLSWHKAFSLWRPPYRGRLANVHHACAI